LRFSKAKAYDIFSIRNRKGCVQAVLSPGSANPSSTNGLAKAVFRGQTAAKRKGNFETLKIFE
jgi:hypothetical protein